VGPSLFLFAKQCAPGPWTQHMHPTFKATKVESYSTNLKTLAHRVNEKEPTSMLVIKAIAIIVPQTDYIIIVRNLPRGLIQYHKGIY
jgi:hypothetical protein